METLYRKVEIDLITNGFTKVEHLDRWFINFQGRTYYVFMDGGKWWVLINKNGSDIKLNQTGFDSFTEIADLLNALSLNEIFPDPTAQLQPTEKLPSELLREYFKNTPREQVLKDWESTSDHDNVNSPKVSELFEVEGGENELEVWLNRQIEKCQQLDMPREEWAFIQVLKKINSNQ